LDTDVKRARDRAEAAFKKKEQQLREGQQARAEYETARAATREKTARLRALRLARDAAWKRLFRRPKNSRLDRIESE
jgi:Tfp pilus assembly protein PilX